MPTTSTPPSAIGSTRLPSPPLPAVPSLSRHSGGVAVHTGAAPDPDVGRSDCSRMPSPEKEASSAPAAVNLTTASVSTLPSLAWPTA